MWRVGEKYDVSAHIRRLEAKNHAGRIRLQNDQYAWADDLSWIVGRLEFEPIEGGYWSLEFGDDDAPHGGRLVLGRPTLPAGAAEGSLVRVTGHPEPFGATIFMGGTPYVVESVEPVM
jgi:hypothetical protein